MNAIDKYYRTYSLLYDGPTDKPIVETFRNMLFTKPLRNYIFDAHLSNLPHMGPVILHLIGLSGRFQLFRKKADELMREVHVADKGAFHYLLILRGIFENSPMWLDMARTVAEKEGSRTGYAIADIFHQLLEPDGEIDTEDDNLKALEKEPGFNRLYNTLQLINEALDMFFVFEEVDEDTPVYQILRITGILDILKDTNNLQMATLWYALMIGGRFNQIWASFSQHARDLYRGIERLKKNTYYMDALLLFLLVESESDRETIEEIAHYLREESRKPEYVLKHYNTMLKKLEKWLTDGNMELLEREFPLIPESLHFTNLPILYLLNDMEHLPSWASRLLSSKLKSRKLSLMRVKNCPYCESKNIIKFGKVGGIQRYRCKDCGRTFLETSYQKILTIKRIYRYLRETLPTTINLATYLYLAELVSHKSDFINKSITINPINLVNVHSLMQAMEDRLGLKVNKNIFYQMFRGIYLLNEPLSCMEKNLNLKYVRIKITKVPQEDKLEILKVEVITDEPKEKVEAVLRRCFPLEPDSESEVEKGQEDDSSEEILKERAILPIVEITSTSDRTTFIYPEDEKLRKALETLGVRLRKSPSKSRKGKSRNKKT